MVHNKVVMVHSKVAMANSNSRVAMVNHKVRLPVNSKVATVNSNRVVATQMIGFAAAVGTTTLPEEQNAISANNLEDQMQSWLNHLHSKAAMVNSKAVTVNNKAVMVNSKAVMFNSKVVMANSKVVTVTKGMAEGCKHSTPMIGCAALVGTTTLPEGQNAISVNNLVTQIQTQFKPPQEQAQTRLSILTIGAVVDVETTTLREGQNAIGASNRKMQSMLGRLQIHKIQRQQHQLQS